MYHILESLLGKSGWGSPGDLRGHKRTAQAGGSWPKLGQACSHLKGTEQGREASGQWGAGLTANSLKCVGERGKEESVSSQQPRHLVEDRG